MNRALCWLRRDLRLRDHAPLAWATARAASVAPIFVFDRNILDALEDEDDRRVSFIHRSLAELEGRLASLGSGLTVASGDPVDEIPRLAQEFGADAVVAGADHDPYALARDRNIERSLARLGIAFHLMPDIVVFDPTELQTQAGKPYIVFTPYRNAWRQAFDRLRVEERVPDLRRLAPKATLPHSAGWSLEAIGFRKCDLPLAAGERGAQAALESFQTKLPRYRELRDLPSEDATSRLSVHLRFGTLSIRDCVRLALENPSEGADKWLDELIWREFYQMILARFPHVVGRSFRPELDGIAWPGLDEHFQAWCEGRTGFPIVDAAMRELNATGWMHNRLRMIVASFLVKDLLVDWRRGEAYFARKLLDFELASNNGGWQWCASTGCDAQPYFRIFNPMLQSQKFDPSGAFIRKWCPELAGLPDASIHEPWKASEFDQATAGCRVGEDYPLPIVDHQVQRARAIRLFQAASQLRT